MLMLIYSSIIQPQFDYAITIWGYTCDNNLHKIQRLQNRAARIVTGNYDYYNVFVPYAHLESCNNNFTHRGPIMWNSLPDYIKTCGTLPSFKAKMKLYIMN